MGATKDNIDLEIRRPDLFFLSQSYFLHPFPPTSVFDFLFISGFQQFGYRGPCYCFCYLLLEVYWTSGIRELVFFIHWKVCSHSLSFPSHCPLPPLETKDACVLDCLTLSHSSLAVLFYHPFLCVCFSLNSFFCYVFHFSSYHVHIFLYILKHRITFIIAISTFFLLILLSVSLLDLFWLIFFLLGYFPIFFQAK